MPPGAEAEAALLLGLERGRLRSLPGGVDLARFTGRPLAQTDRFAFWRRWLVDEPRGWDMSGRTGSVAYDEQDLAPFQTGAPVLLYVGRFTAVKRLPLLIAAHARASERLGTPAPLVLVGGHPGEWEGEHPLAAAARLGNRNVFLAGWRAHELLPKALNAADLLVLPSVGEAFGLVLVEAMACGLPVVACATHGPGGDRCRRQDRLARPSRRRRRAHRRARRGRKRSRGTTRPWRARPRREPPLRLAGDHRAA